VANPFTQEKDPAIEVVATVVSVLNRRRNFIPQLWGDALVAVHNQHPVVVEGEIFQGPVLFLGPATVEVELNHLSSVAFGNFNGAVFTLGVHHEDFISPSHALKAGRQVLFLVFSGD
jgi:hypothetical protein